MKYLFISRLIIYILAIIIPFFHPAIAVSYDLYMKIVLFFLMPFSFFIAFFYQPPKRSFLTGFSIFLITTILVSLIFYPLRAILFPISFALWGYLSTLLIFNGNGRFNFIAAIEIFALGYLYYKILMYTRSSEDIAKMSKNIINIHFILTLFSFVIHSMILYIVSYGKKKIHEYKKEFATFGIISLPLLFIFAYILPPDFVKHQAVFNELEPEPPLTPLDNGEGFLNQPRGGGNPPDFRNGKPLGKRNEKYPSELQNKNQEQNNPNQQQEVRPEKQEQEGSSQSQSKNRLEGVPSDQWEKFQNSEEAQKGKQMAVMIIASEIQPVYAAESYLSLFNSKTGFKEDPNESLNQLKHAHLISTWKDPLPNFDNKRSPYPIFYLSTIKERVIAYRPFQIEPTIMNQRYHPFDLSYTAISAISKSVPADWKNIHLNDLDKNEPEIKKNLEISLEIKDLQILKNYLYSLISPKEKNYFKIIDSILKNYKTFQYKLGFIEETNIERIIEFLTSTKEGDCTEFSASTTILFRLAGIPTRVVHGWVASRDLQTPAHVGGLILLRKKIPYLQKYDINQLYLITTAHRHAWIQVYIPSFGWVDIETTSYAIPPKPAFDPNARDVVIPLIEEEPNPPIAKKFEFPYKLFAIFIGSIIVITLIILYLYKIILNIFYKVSILKYSPKALKMINQYYYMKLWEFGYPKRQFYETPLDYTKKMPETQKFAEILSDLKFRVYESDSIKQSKFDELKKNMKESLFFLRPKSIFKRLKAILTLKGIFYKI